MSKFKTAISFFSRLAGIGPRQATRIVLGLLNWPPEELARFAQIINQLGQGRQFCQECFNISEQEHCEICLNPRRNQQIICVVEKITDLEALEKSGIYQGVYHVLDGSINPLENILPQHLKISQLQQRLKEKLTPSLNGQAEQLEVIIATNPTTTGETTALYLEEILRPLGLKISRLAKGLSSGSYLEYADSITLQNAFKNRR